MIFSLIVCAAVIGIAYYHYAQGFFSAMISAVICVIAAVMAVSLHERAVLSSLKGAGAEYAVAGTLIVMFAVIYVTLRTTFDKVVPGQIRLPVVVDRVG